jgi:SAM-dependent methyltransferase
MDEGAISDDTRCVVNEIGPSAAGSSEPELSVSMLEAPASSIAGADILLRDYRPYSDADVRVERFDGAPPNPEELQRMNDRVAKILDSYTLASYASARGGLAEAEEWILRVLARSGPILRGRVLEFGAGNAKLSAIISRSSEVDEVVVNDFSEPLLTEIAPRVVCALRGRLDKIRFLVGDMHALHKLDERFDVIVCYLAVHHLYLPEHFFFKISDLLPAGGKVLCLREPAIPQFGPFRQVRRAIESAREHRRQGESENIYTVGQYARMAEPTFAFRLVHMNMFERRFRWMRDRGPAEIWVKPFEIGYLLEKVAPGTAPTPSR